MKLCRTAVNTAIAASIAMLAGCSLQPIYKRPSEPVAAAYPVGEAYAADEAVGGTPGRNTSPAAETGWRNFMTDPRLVRLVEIALKNNRDLRVAMLNVREVQAQYRVQRAALFPQITASAGASQERTPAGLSAGKEAVVDHSYSVGLGAAWEVDFFGRLGSVRDAAYQQYVASSRARQAAEILLVSQVADQYLTILGSDAQLAVTQDTLKTANASYEIVLARSDAGTASDLDLKLSQVAVEQAKVSYEAQVRLRAQAENAMVLLLGQPTPADLPQGTPLDAQNMLADIPAGLPSDLLGRRPDVLQAEAVLRAENATIGAARAAFFPQITLTGALGSGSPMLSGLLGSGSSAWSFVPSLLLPIFNAGANQANLDIAEVQKDIGVAQYEKTIQTAFREVSDGLAARGTYDKQLAAATRYRDAERSRLQLAQMRYDTGVDDYLGVLTAQTDLYTSEQALVSAKLDRLTNLVDLYRSLGGGWLAETGEAPRPVVAGL